MPTRQVVNSSAYCQERRFSSSCSFSRHSLSRPFVWKKVSDNKEDSSDESSSQKIPSNWFPEITLCGNNLWKSTQRGVCVCMCVRRAHEKKKKKNPSSAGLRMRTWDRGFDPRDWRNNAEFAIQRDSFFFFFVCTRRQEKRYQVTPGSRRRVIPYEVVKKKGGLKTWDCT